MNTKKAKAEIEKAINNLPLQYCLNYSDKEDLFKTILKHGPSSMDIESQSGGYLLKKNITNQRGVLITFDIGVIRAKPTADCGLPSEGATEVASVICDYLEAWHKQIERGNNF